MLVSHWMDLVNFSVVAAVFFVKYGDANDGRMKIMVAVIVVFVLCSMPIVKLTIKTILLRKNNDQIETQEMRNLHYTYDEAHIKVADQLRQMMRYENMQSMKRVNPPEVHSYESPSFSNFNNLPRRITNEYTRSHY